MAHPKYQLSPLTDPGFFWWGMYRTRSVFRPLCRHAMVACSHWRCREKLYVPGVGPCAKAQARRRGLLYLPLGAGCGPPLRFLRACDSRTRTQLALARHSQKGESQCSWGSVGEIRLNIVERDKWYFVVECRNCDRATVLREAPAPEEVAKPVMPAFPWKCRYCGKKQRFRTEQVERCQGIYI
jgi:hypothetical protein